MTHLIEIDVATGKVQGEWQGEGESPTAKDGRIFIDVSEQKAALGSFSFKMWIGGAAVGDPAAPLSVTQERLFDLFTRDQRKAAFDLKDTDPRVRDTLAWVAVRRSIDLKDPVVVGGVSYLREIGVFGDPKSKDAAASVTRILSNVLP